MKISSLTPQQISRKLKTEGLWLRTGFFTNHIKSPFRHVAEGIHAMYGDYFLDESAGFADFHIEVLPPLNHRRWFRKQAYFYLDGIAPFAPLSADQSFPLLEWGMNWCVSSRLNTHLIIHGAVIEKNGYAALMSAASGSGKSTLCAALINSGWRLLSDELTILSIEDCTVMPLPRPVSLKNESIDVIHSFCPDAIIGRRSHDTAKGTVAHMKAPQKDVERSMEKANPAWLIFPQYLAGSELCFDEVSKGLAAIRLIRNSFNYSALGKSAFVALTDLMDKSSCYELKYCNLDQAITLFDELAEGKI